MNAARRLILGLGVGLALAGFVVTTVAVTYYVAEHRWNVCRDDGYSKLVCVFAALH